MAFLTPSALPREIFQQIIDDLCVWDKVRLSRINKEWQAYFGNNPWVWERLDFGHIRHDIFWERNQQLLDITTMAKFYIAKSKLGLRKLHINNTNYMRCNFWFLDLQNCPNLVDLKLDCVSGDLYPVSHLAEKLPNLRNLDIGARFHLDIPALFLQNSLKLESATFRFTRATDEQCSSTGMISPALKSLVFRVESLNPDAPQLIFPNNIIERAVNLESLIIEGFHKPITSDYRHLTKLQELQIARCEAVAQFLVPPSITTLEISLPVLCATPGSNPLLGLKILTLDYFLLEGDGQELQILGWDLETAFKNVGNELEELNLNYDIRRSNKTHDGLDSTVMTTLLSLCKFGKVKNLTMQLSGWLDDTTLSLIPSIFPSLIELSFGGSCRRVTDDGLKKLFTALPDLRISYMNLGRNLGDGMLQWMKDRNISANFSSEDDGNIWEGLDDESDDDDF